MSRKLSTEGNTNQSGLLSVPGKMLKQMIRQTTYLLHVSNNKASVVQHTIR